MRWVPVMDPSHCCVRDRRGLAVVSHFSLLSFFSLFFCLLSLVLILTVVACVALTKWPKCAVDVWQEAECHCQLWHFLFNERTKTKKISLRVFWLFFFWLVGWLDKQRGETVSMGSEQCFRCGQIRKLGFSLLDENYDDLFDWHLKLFTSLAPKNLYWPSVRIKYSITSSAKWF